MSGGGAGISSTGFGQPSQAQGGLGPNPYTSTPASSAAGFGVDTYTPVQTQSSVPFLERIGSGLSGMNTGVQNTTGNQISDLYQKILGREADEGGLAHWTAQANSGMSMADIKNHFINSEEYLNNPAAQARYKSQFSNLVAPQPLSHAPSVPAPMPQPAQDSAPQAVTQPPPRPVGPVFNAPLITQDNNGGAINYQYNRGGIASLVRR